MNDNRREFLEKGLVLAGTVFAGLAAGRIVRKVGSSDAEVEATNSMPALNSTNAPPPEPVPALPGHGHGTNGAAVRSGVPGRKWVMVVDLAKCDGCKNCTTACNEMHNVPPDREWIRVFKMKDAHSTAPYWFPKPCFHCDNPPCTKVCPVGATFKRQDGIVLIDTERCIGCRFCMAACPYSTRLFNWGRPQPTASDSAYSPETGCPRRVGTVEKCDFCPDMAVRGQLPACVAACTMGALYFGDQNEDAVSNGDETLRFSQLLEERAGYRFLEELGTEARVYYLPPKAREYPGPKVPSHSLHHHA